MLGLSALNSYNWVQKTCVLFAKKQGHSGTWKENASPPVSPARGFAPGQEAGNSGREDLGVVGRDQEVRGGCQAPGSLVNPEPCWVRARIPWGGDGSPCARRRGNAKWAEQDGAEAWGGFYNLFLVYFQEAQGILALECSISCTGIYLSRKDWIFFKFWLSLHPLFISAPRKMLPFLYLKFTFYIWQTKFELHFL